MTFLYSYSPSNLCIFAFTDMIVSKGETRSSKAVPVSVSMNSSITRGPRFFEAFFFPTDLRCYICSSSMTVIFLRSFPNPIGIRKPKQRAHPPSFNLSYRHFGFKFIMDSFLLSTFDVSDDYIQIQVKNKLIAR